MVKGLQSKACSEQLRLPGLFILEKRRLKSDFTAVYNFFMGSSQGGGADLLCLLTSNRT